MASTAATLPPPPTIIVGGGAVGLTLAMVFAGAAPTALIVKPAQRERLAAQPLRLRGARSLLIPPGALTVTTTLEPGEFPAGAHIWLAVKAYDLGGAIEWLAPRLPPAAVVVIISNGLGVYAEAAAALGGRASLVRVLPSFGAALSAPGEVILAGDIVAAVAAPQSAASSAHAVSKRLRAANGIVTEERDVALAEWKKAAVNMIVNPLCTLAGAPNGALLDDPALHALVPPLLEEIRSIALTAGHDLGGLTAAAFFEGLKVHASNTNSMLVDIRAGRRTELDYISGRFLQIADTLGAAAPLSRSLYELVKTVETLR